MSRLAADHNHDRHRHAPHIEHGLEPGHGHGHPHAHEHGTSVWSRIGHRFSGVFGGHSLDAANQVDEVLEADAEGRRALHISLALLAATALLQAVVVVFTGSVALLGDTLHNVADALTAVPLLIAFRLARRPATNRYTYGYRRAEDLAGLFVIAMIALSAVLARGRRSSG
jgi:Co/Zn/Cd efflux system component